METFLRRKAWAAVFNPSLLSPAACRAIGRHRIVRVRFLLMEDSAYEMARALDELDEGRRKIAVENYKAALREYS